ncbi:Mov34/MPN/PAD-1 family protein [Candidatus Micrarchaeota archaeon]|nr:Mov34/MPN/PAD-1 family protein [Candidatus Micrarchaeota archaeon]
MYDVYLAKAAIEKADAHSLRMAEKNLEALGLLVGDAFHFEDRQWVLVEDYLTAPNISSPVSVRFTEEALAEIAADISNRKAGKLIVGWCHSHPGYGCFLSLQDLETQQKYFPEEFHIAMVIDPTGCAGNKSLKRIFRLKNGGCHEVSFAVFTEK